MATFEERVSPQGKKSIRVRIRMKGYKSISKSFDRKTDAKRWASQVETQLKENRYFKTKEGSTKTLADAIKRYKSDPNIKSQKNFKNKVQILDWWKQEIGEYILSNVTSATITEKRDQLAKTEFAEEKTYSNSRVNRYLATISHLFSMAVREWDWIEFNPARNVSKLKEPRGVVRFLSEQEREDLLEACQQSKSKYLYTVVLIALTTGMRKSEITNLTWDCIDFTNQKITLSDTKNGEVRVLPMVDEVRNELIALSKLRVIDNDYVFLSNDHRSSANIETAWKGALKTAKITNFRFHDLRHSCASYLAMSGASTTEISEILGHKTLQMVKRYSHLSNTHISDVVNRMNRKFITK